VESFQEVVESKWETLPRRRLGQVLVGGDFLSSDALDDALREQKRTRERLGEILLRTGALDTADLSAARYTQTALRSVGDAVRAAGGDRRPLGELLLDAKRIGAGQLDAALIEQRRAGGKLGEILVRRGLLTSGELEALLSFQLHQNGRAPLSERFRLGEILVASGQISREQLDRALARQKTTKKKIGELLVEAGDVQSHQVTRGLTLQRKLMTAALAAALSFATAASVHAGRNNSAAHSSSARITVTATIADRTMLRIDHQAATLVITDADISRGYVDVPAASRVEVRNNNPQGYLLVFQPVDRTGGMFREVRVQGLGREVEIRPGGGFVPQPYARIPVTMELGYRFVLGKDALPGTYAWPFSISARPF